VRLTKKQSYMKRSQFLKNPWSFIGQFVYGNADFNISILICFLFDHFV
jgi:hypothetical protein